MRKKFCQRLNTQYRYSYNLKTQYFNTFHPFKILKIPLPKPILNTCNISKRHSSCCCQLLLWHFYSLKSSELWNWKKKLQTKNKLVFTWFWLRSKENKEKTKIKPFQYWVKEYFNAITIFGRKTPKILKISILNTDLKVLEIPIVLNSHTLVANYLGTDLWQKIL